MEDYFFRAGVNALRSRAEDKKEKREHLKDVMLRVLNGEEVLPTKGTTLSIAKTAEVVKAFIDPVRKGVDENVLKIATDMGFKHDDFKSGNIIQKTKDGKAYIRSGFYNENIFPAKEIEKVIEKAKGADANIDLETARTNMQSLQAYYDENKEVFVRKTSLYTEDEEIDTGVGIELDEELAKALGDLDPASSADSAPQEEPDREDMAADMEESNTLSNEEIADMSQVEIDPSLFGDEMDFEEDVASNQDEAKAVESAQAVTVELV